MCRIRLVVFIDTDHNLSSLCTQMALAAVERILVIGVDLLKPSSIDSLLTHISLADEKSWNELRTPLIKKHMKWSFWQQARSNHLTLPKIHLIVIEGEHNKDEFKRLYRVYATGSNPLFQYGENGEVENVNAFKDAIIISVDPDAPPNGPVPLVQYNNSLLKVDAINDLVLRILPKIA
ncbi:hypothetical protein ACOME3_000098 [Neoechinorhynchus agilis]